MNDPQKADFAIHEVFDKDHKISFPNYPEDLDTMDCWCFSHLSPMFKEDLEKFKSGNYK